MYSKHRLEALSDGIFAIAMTLLVLELKVPTNVEHGQLWHALQHEAHVWVPFVITFGISAVFWSLQHRVFDAVKSMGTSAVVPTFVFLGFISVLPFSMSLWGQHLREPLAFFIYFMNQLAIATALAVKLELARLNGHLHGGVEASVLRLRLWTMCLIMGVAAVGAWFLPIEYMGLVPAVFAVAARLLTRSRIARLRNEAAVQPDAAG